MSGENVAPAGRVVYGIRPVGELLRRGSIDLLWAERRGSRALESLLRDARRANVDVVAAAREDLDALAGGGSHQGVVAVAGEYRYCDLEDLVASPTAPLLLAVDGVTDPQNLGAMIRSAVVLGATGCVLTRDRCAAVTPTVVRVSSGATEHLRCARVTNLSRALGQLKDHGLWIAGTVERQGTPPSEADLTVPLALVMGSEQRGLRPLVARSCDLLLTIPTPGPIAALNVGAATTAVFYEAARQRQAS